MRTYLSLFLFSIGIFFPILELQAVGESDRIDMGVSPIVDEFQIEKGQTLSRTVKFFNNSNKPYTLYISSEDCTPGTNYGTPKCEPYTGSGKDLDKASTWITPGISGNFTVGARSSRTITYSVSAPANASPGGHYGAIFFNNPDGNTAGNNSVGMIRRIGMLFMITIPGQTLVDTKIGDILVDNGTFTGSVGPGGQDQEKTFLEEPIPYVEKKLKKLAFLFSDDIALRNLLNEINPLWVKPTLDEKDFNVTMKIPVKNDGNTHIKPTGKIYLYDQNGEQLTKIGKISVVDENGIYLGEKIVDYLPINDEGGNVLPGTERVFQTYWNGFAYNTIDATGNSIIAFESPAIHYSQATETASQFIYPWERMSLRKAEKTLTAKVDISYMNPKTKEQEVKNLEIPLAVSYLYIAKVMNWSAIIGFLLLIWIFRIILKKRNRRIEELEDETHELEDEISVLERAQKSFASGTVKTRKNATPKKESKKEEKIKKPTKTSTKNTELKKEVLKKTDTKEKPTTAKKKATKKDTSTK